jgi:hypothetical protein
MSIIELLLQQILTVLPNYKTTDSFGGEGINETA